MGYWDKKEAKDAQEKREPVVTKEVKKEEYDTINHEALQEFETLANESAKNVLNDVAGIADDIARQKRQFSDLLSTGYWCAIVFNNDVQKEEFLHAVGFNPSWTYINGKEFARRVGIKIEEPDHKYQNERPVQKSFKDRARSIPEKLTQN